MNKTDKALIQVAIAKLEMLQDDLADFKEIQRDLNKRLTSLEKLLMFFKGMVALIAAGASVAATYLLKFIGG